MRSRVIFAIGALAFGAAQIIWALGHSYASWRGAWITKAGPGIAFCFVVFVIVAALVIGYRRKPTELAKRALHLWLGAMAGVVGALLIVGPGNLWPLVLVFDGVIIGGGVVIGAVISAAMGGKHAA